MRDSGNMDREAMQAKRKELVEESDIQLKTIFTPAPYKTWKDLIEPSLSQ